MPHASCLRRRFVPGGWPTWSGQRRGAAAWTAWSKVSSGELRVLRADEESVVAPSAIEPEEPLLVLSGATYCPFRLLQSAPKTPSDKRLSLALWKENCLPSLHFCARPRAVCAPAAWCSAGWCGWRRGRGGWGLPTGWPWAERSPWPMADFVQLCVYFSRGIILNLWRLLCAVCCVSRGSADCTLPLTLAF